LISLSPGLDLVATRGSGRRNLGFKAAVVEREHLGGICLNWLYSDKGASAFREDFRGDASREVLWRGQRQGRRGVAVIKRSRDVAARLSRGVEGSLKKNKVEVIWGEARLNAPGQITVAAPAR
jgi:dihydrolipoamide dehydrogenase